MRINPLAAALVIGASLLTVAQQNSTVHSDVLHALDGMNSDKWEDREKAFNEMPTLADVQAQNPADAEQLKVGIIHLLNVENMEVQKAKQTGTKFTTDAHSEYYGNLIGVVASMNDERAIPSLLGAITTGGMATRSIAGFGDKALDAVLKKLQDPEPLVRTSVLFTIRYMLKMKSVADPGSQVRIRNAIRSSLEDADFGVRDAAISAIEYVEDREQFVPALEKLAQTDPVKLPGTPDDGGDGGQFYPVRQDARRLLRKIAHHE
jgi:hypothetical protein